ncbi:hypothetical protein [Pelagibacterium lacus]|uniref:Tetratricopeptide repeat protein n=1 Tax=Pelagibacterium lacus TaxID=2282655 RepID=A0A369W6G0_9HYPH|nr:hypothetical protein [Pelagibacterium lacus]RDE10266.1 hypothetical protein DVH29_02445 [Pelagibacterium lacus]
MSGTTGFGAGWFSAARQASLALFLSLPLVAAAFAQEPIAFEAEPQDGYARLILSFPERLNLPAYTVSADNGVLIIALDGVEMDGTLPDVGMIIGDYASVVRFDPDREAIRMGLRAPLRINTIAAGEQLYIDLMPTGWSGPPPGLPEPVIARLAERAESAARIAEERRRAEMVEEYRPRALISLGRHPTFTRVMFDWNVGTKAEFSQDGLDARLKFDWPVPIDLYPLLAGLPPQIASVTADIAPSGTELRFTLAQDVPLRFYENGLAQFVLDIDDPAAAADRFDMAALIAAAEGLATPAAEQAEAGMPSLADAAPVVAPEAIVPHVSAIGSTVRVVFPFASETPSAVFRRGNVVWLVFDTATPIAQPSAAGGDILDGLVSAFTVQAAGASQVVRMELSQNRLATLGSEGRSWVISLGDTLLDVTDPIAFERRRSASGFYEIVAGLHRPFKVHQLRDPDVGDILDVVTALPPAQGVVRDLAYVDFLAPRSAHGLVIKPLHDGVRVAIEGEAVAISAATGLTVSEETDVRFRMPINGTDSALDLVAHYVPNPLQFEERRAELMARAAASEGRELDMARLDLAQFYLGNGFAHESIGVLGVMASQLRQTVLETEMLATLAAANTLAGRTQEALSILNSDPMRDEADAMIWRAIARGEAGIDPASARLDALGARSVVKDYPNWVQARFALAAIRAALTQGDADMAADLLAGVELSTLSRDQMAQYELFSGMLDHLNGRETEALESYGRVIASDRRPSAAEAVLRTIELLDATGRLDVHRAASALSAQAALWRGGPLEVAMSEKLADLLYRDDQYRQAFVMTQDMANTIAAGPALDRLLERARIEFAGLYLDGKADVLPPIEALSLYYDFRQLTPPGSDGDMMIRNLAERLVKVDLLGQAAELLQYQVDNRLQGAARAQVAADLAVVYMAGHDPNAALSVLSATRLAGLPPGLERQRRVLEAGALISAGRQALALDLLSGLTGRDAELLRIEALWSTKRYREASEKIELLYAPQADDGALTPMARMNVIKAAVGYLFANDTIGMARLRTRYSEAMAQVPEWPMFALVTEEMDINAAGIRDLARQVANTESINAFLNAYRETYAGENALTPLRAAERTQSLASL